MKTLRVPGKIILFGEWAVMEGAPGVAIAIDQFCESRVEYDKKQPPAISWKTPLETIEAVSTHERGTTFLKRLVCHPLLKRKNDGSAKIETVFHWNYNFGFGSSSALVLTALSLLTKDPSETTAEKVKLWKRSRLIQRDLQGGKGSGIDLAAQLFGGCVVVRKDHIAKRILKMPKEILFLHSGEKYSTRDAFDKGVPPELIEQISRSSERFLRNHEWQECIEEHHRAFESANLVDRRTSELKRALQSAGIPHALKSCGAGGSETLMLWASENEHSRIIKTAEPLGFSCRHYEIQASGIEQS